MPLWPDWIDPARAGLNESEFLALASREILDGDDQELLRVAGVNVLTSEEAEELGIPSDERDLAHGVVILEHTSWIRINPVTWAGIQNARDEEERRSAEVKKLGPKAPIPFWLCFAEPTPEAVLLQVPEDAEELPLPDFDDVRGWNDVDEEVLLGAARCALVMTIPANVHGFRYIRGSVVRDLVARPLRALAEWVEAYPHLVITDLGGLVDAEETAEMFGDGRVPFWEALQMPDGSVASASSETIGDLISATQQLVRLGFFEQHGLDPVVDAYALSHFGVRSWPGWERSDFARLMVPRAPSPPLR